MKKLPSHTTRYFAEQAYRNVIHRGDSAPKTYKTVQGVEITVMYHEAEKEMMITWEHKGNICYKREPIRKSWF